MGRTTRLAPPSDVTLDAGGNAGRPAIAGLPERYEDCGVIIGVGGMGEVRRVHDRTLGRTVAMKINHVGRELDRLLERFRREIGIAARLEHPNIVPVYDAGALSDGRLYYTMREVHGETLEQLILELDGASTGGAWGVAPRGTTFRSVVRMLEQVAHALAYAHRKRVVHRDVKPGNIIIGEHGEVQLLDWGIALWLDEVAEQTTATQVADPGGTPGFMAPEQSEREFGGQGPWTDAWAIGATLYSLFAGHPPSWRVRFAVEPVGPALERDTARRPPIPAELRELCLDCLVCEADRREFSLERIAARLRAWNDGVERRERALVVVSEAARYEAEAAELRGLSERMRRAADQLLSRVPAWAPATRKRKGWRLQDRARAALVAAEERDERRLQALHRAIEVDPGMPEAHQQLGRWAVRRLIAAEDAGEQLQVARYEVMLREHDTAAWSRWRKAEAEVSLVTAPPGATVELSRFVLVDRRLVPSDPEPLGITPLDHATVPAGSLLLTVRAPGFAPVRYPVYVGRGQHWSGVAPGESVPHPILLLPEGQLGPDDCYVPAGWFKSGGGPSESDALSPRRYWVDGFVVRRFQVTNAEYAQFLEYVAAREGAESIAGLLPRAMGQTETPEVWTLDPNGRVSWGVGPDVGALLPVVGTSHVAATAYASWFAARADRPWRLLEDQEWEKAARGVDGRRFAWGPHFDPAWSNTIHRRRGRPHRGPVGEFTTDESLYRVRDMCGNVRDWCANAYLRDGPAPDGSRIVVPGPPGHPTYRVMRGGAWANGEAFSALCSRTALTATTGTSLCGFRIGYVVS